ncbi:MAG: flagellar biosynthetic protein FliO [Thermoanaerobacteraceae bacterium]|nr:flagellar biosynthetic protein FliO [Thermoanaerobacteraceae bacterium]
MKREAIWITIFIIFVVFSAAIQASANPVDIDNINKYNFDVPDDISKTTSAPLSVMTFVIYFIFFVIITALAYFTTRLLGKHQKKIRIKSKYMEVVDGLQLSQDNALYIVKTPDGLLLLGTGKESISLLKKLGAEESELIMQAEENQTEDSFPVYLSNYLNKIKGSEHNKFGGSK